MQPDLQRIISELKKETCPQRIRDQVRGRIAARETAAPRLRYAIPAVFVAIVLVCGLLVGQWRMRENLREQAKLAQLTRERVHVAHQAEEALGLVGSVLIDAGNHSEKIISDRTIPPLRDSLETARNKIIQQ